MADAVNYEQLDLFYLGREVDPETGKALTGFARANAARHAVTENAGRA